ncbi:class I SAM-dependent DNA methyltransferase [Saccharomonospora saliphila]|uniref:class I SAM-dependent DNA methyltransferase n=1 Tax=Saccharomonospora saliphila TaxID=369829 RepID=UPI000361E119|nr:class I SAM-dependent methyltransferase [Saccharomonospora saliphila]
MGEYGPATFGDVTADHYDDWVTLSTPERETRAAVDFLAGLAPGGRALELGIGTGRVGLPLAERDLEVHGIEASEKMIGKLREKPGGATFPVHVGDFADVAAPGEFDLIFIVLNTIFSLTTQDEQIRCLTNVASKLAPNGILVSEALVPDPARFDRNQRVNASQIESDRIKLDISRRDPLSQVITSSHVVIGPHDTTMHTVKARHVSPAEHDLMCRIAGLRLRDRFGGWRGEPFTATSTKHISVYVKTDD